jgi:hypothetical protein
MIFHKNISSTLFLKEGIYNLSGPDLDQAKSSAPKRSPTLVDGYGIFKNLILIH